MAHTYTTSHPAVTVVGHVTRVAGAGQDAAAVMPRGKATFRALYAEDGVHPSGAGTYLEACVVASAITGALLPNRQPVVVQTDQTECNKVLVSAGQSFEM